jgi:hypothetical protein
MGDAGDAGAHGLGRPALLEAEAARTEEAGLSGVARPGAPGRSLEWPSRS